MAHGDLTAEAVYDLFDQGSLFPVVEDDPHLLELAEALRHRAWTDEEAATLIRAVKSIRDEGKTIDIRLVTRWVLAHDDGGPAESVIDCMRLEAPDDIDVLRVLSRRGSQKVVYAASWRLAQQEVVLKRILGAPDSVARILSRELQAHPLSILHPNIIETHVMVNRRSETFLVERRLPVLLSDTRYLDAHEAANLLRDLTSAVTFLHHHDRVHGDIKPDNVGMRDGRYVLLDFGICRPIADFTPDATPTGSLRTRAPELLVGSGYDDPTRIDIWALAASVFNAVAKRFPLVDRGETIPRISSPRERAEFEQLLAKRVRDEWAKRIDMTDVPEALRPVLSAMLSLRPSDRPTGVKALEVIERDLAAFLRSSDSTIRPSSRFSPHDEVEQLRWFLGRRPLVDRLPARRRQEILGRVRELETLPGFSGPEREEIRSFVKLLG